MAWYEYCEFGYDFEDFYDSEPYIMVYDRIIHTTKKAVLYGHKQYQFWVPKSVHNRDLPDVIQVAGWFTIIRTLSDPMPDPEYDRKHPWVTLSNR